MPSDPQNDRRAANRRSGTERRMVNDRRFSDERRTPSGAWVGVETPAEHIRNAMQLLISGLESETTLSTPDFARIAESALSRLTVALSALESSRRRS